MKTLLALTAIFFGSIISNGFNWFEGIIASFIFVIALIQDVHSLGEKYKVEKLKNELIEKLEENE